MFIGQKTLMMASAIPSSSLWDPVRLLCFTLLYHAQFFPSDGKDIPYADFHPKSFSEIPAEQKSKVCYLHYGPNTGPCEATTQWSAWETPEPTFWTKHDYIVVRVDERGLGQSPGFLDTMSASTANDFACCVEWCASQPWSSGKVGLLGVSYFGGSQWRVAARQPKGLACIIPWEGMSDYYRDRCRQGGIYSNGVRLRDALP